MGVDKIFEADTSKILDGLLSVGIVLKRLYISLKLRYFFHH